MVQWYGLGMVFLANKSFPAASASYPILLLRFSITGKRVAIQGMKSCYANYNHFRQSLVTFRQITYNLEVIFMRIFQTAMTLGCIMQITMKNRCKCNQRAWSLSLQRWTSHQKFQGHSHETLSNISTLGLDLIGGWLQNFVRNWEIRCQRGCGSHFAAILTTKHCCQGPDAFMAVCVHHWFLSITVVSPKYPWYELNSSYTLALLLEARLAWIPSFIPLTNPNDE